VSDLVTEGFIQEPVLPTPTPMLQPLTDEVH
jgi:hypothetical protein